MLVTEEDAVMKKWCPMIPASLGAEAIWLHSLQSGPQRPLQQHAVSDVFRSPASSDERAFLSVSGIGVHDVAMGDQQSAPDRAQGILRPGRHALHADCTLMESCVGWR